MEKHLIELNEKECYVLWYLSAWFRPFTTSSLSQKLWPGDDVVSKMRPKFDAELDRILAEKGSWLKEHLAEKANSATT